MIAGKSTPLVAIDAVVLDTETTGLDSRTARLVQVGAVRITSGAIEPNAFLDLLVNPGVSIPPATTLVHGISDHTVRSAPSFGAIAGEVASFIGGRIVIGHTIGYDVTVLRREAELGGIAWKQPQTLDIRLLARIAAPSLAHYDLDRLCAWLGIENPARHTGLGDAQATAQVFIKLVPKLRERGIRTIAEAAAASKRAAEREGQSIGAPVEEPVAGEETPALQVIDSFPYRHRVSDVMSAPALSVPPDTTVSEAIKTLVDQKASSVFVQEGSRLGIVTERDLLRSVGAEGAGALSRPVAGIMKSPLITVRDDDFVYRAIGRIERHGIRHLGVVDADGKLVGAVTTRNLLRHRATTAIVLGDEIDCAESAAELAFAWAKLTPMARSFVAEDVDARLVAEVVSTEICAITARSAVLAERQMAQDGRGQAPAAYCVLVLGSAGRGESLLAADQDNAIVFASGEPGGAEDLWFAEMAKHLTRILDEAGVPLCKGGVMASNAAWRMSEANWRKTIDHWVSRQNPSDLLNTDIFFDAVPVHGDEPLGRAVVEYAWQRGGQAQDFMKLMAEAARDWRPPLTILGNIRTDQDGRADLKKGGLLPVFTGARALALKHQVRARSSPGRLRAIADKGGADAGDVEKIIEGHRCLLGALLAQQLADAERGVPLSTRVEINRLSKTARANLKQALGSVSSLVDIVGEGRL